MLERIFHPFDPFVLLFTAGMSFVGTFFLYKVIRWIEGLSAGDKELLTNSIFSKKTWKALGEVIRESLLHKKIFGVNARLGYMHMSLAFGWFMLILIGNIESVYYTGRLFKPIYVSVFWRFFEPGPAFPQGAYTPGFAFWMDLFLLFVLSGLAFAIYKRFHSIRLGMKRTTRQRPADRVALTALWLIFPIRLLAESATCGANGSGSFLTGSLGSLFASFINLDPLVLPLWWTYSFVLMAFFFALPFTRYFHIPSEPVLIFLRKYGIRVSKESPGYTDLSLRACSSCGVCIDPCQLADVLPGRKIQSSYFVKTIRHNEPSDLQWDCMQCGRCEKACPVGLELMPIRQNSRADLSFGTKSNLIGMNGRNGQSHRILYFAGCMTHLTPSIIRSMTKIFDQSGSSWQFYDSDGRACCGRPLKLAGQTDGANRIKEQLQKDFLASGAELLVTSCPICYRMFNEDYDLPGIQVLHHTQYILQLIEWNRIQVDQSKLNAAYHEPCELGRGSGVTREPRELLSKLYQKDVTPDIEGLCCGGSLGGPGLTLATRRAVARGAMNDLSEGKPDVLVTACPLCKKSFTPVSDIPVMDFSESVAQCLIEQSVQPELRKSTKTHRKLPVDAG
ncbi:MAG: heterodisulfide reductase-related iron-sulfur binding cluster [Bacteroidales bacterium]|nr:heterodisulfide reductase-related iron-sulfur binding cluster [Bacteroidales bacterium]